MLLSELLRNGRRDDLDSHWGLEQDILDALEMLEENLDSAQREKRTISQPEISNKRAPVQATLSTNLPSINIAKFDGNYNNWRTFKSLFVSLIYRANYPKANKLAFLKGYLVGDAAKIVQHFDIVDENYDTAWTLICERFDNKRL